MKAKKRQSVIQLERNKEALGGGERSTTLSMNSKAWLHHSAWPAAVGSPPTKEIFGLVEVLGFAGPLVRVRVPGNDGEHLVTSKSISPANEEISSDMATMLHMSEATVLDNITQRYIAGNPYTLTGNILMSVNPCRFMSDVYSADTVTSHAGRFIGDLPPHLYAIAEDVSVHANEPHLTC